jgi:hypothetical protein
MIVGNQTRLRTIDKALPMLGNRSVLFFDVWPEDGESIDEVFKELTSARCHPILDKVRGVVTVFNGFTPPHPRPRP